MSVAEDGAPVHTSPSGRYVLETHPYELKTSHWVFSPLLRDVPTGEVLFDLSRSLWSLDHVAWMSVSEAVLKLREYAGHRPAVTVTVDVAQQTVTQVDGQVRSLGEIEAALSAPIDADTLRAVVSDTILALARSEHADLSTMEPNDVCDVLSDFLRRPGSDGRHLGVLFAPTGDLQEIAIVNGWDAEYLRLSARYDLVLNTTADSMASSQRLHTTSRRRRISARMRVLGIVAVCVALAWWVGGARSVGGLAMVTAALALPFLVALARFMHDPVGTLIRGPKTFRRRLRETARRPAWLLVLIVLVALGLALFVVGVAVMVDGARAR